MNPTSQRTTPKPGILQRRSLRWIAFFLYALLLLSLSSIPGPKLPQELNRVNDKLLHATAYSGAGLLARRAVGSTPRAVLIVALLGALDENYQRLVPGRTPDPRDWAADVAGGFLGALLARFLERRWKRKGFLRACGQKPNATLSK